MSEYQISTEKFTCLIFVHCNGSIYETAPILSRFKGQQLRNLLHWVQHKFNDVTLTNLETMEVVYQK